MCASVNLSCFISIDWSDGFPRRNLPPRLRYDIIPDIIMPHGFDAAVIGLGTMGSAVALSLARRKASAIGFDRFRPPHGFGSHGGATRVFRMAYPELPDYVPLAQCAGTLWERLEQETSARLLTRCGLLTMGTEDSAPIRGIRYCAAALRTARRATHGQRDPKALSRVSSARRLRGLSRDQRRMAGRRHIYRADAPAGARLRCGTRDGFRGDRLAERRPYGSCQNKGRRLHCAKADHHRRSMGREEF